MENRAINMAANRKIVQDGLDRRRLEAKLDAFEDEMIQRCNEHCYDAHLQKMADDAVKINRECQKAKIVSRAEVKRIANQRRKDTAIGCLAFSVYAIVLFWLTTCTYLPLWAAIMYTAGGAVLLALYICRLHGFLGMEVE